MEDSGQEPIKAASVNYKPYDSPPRPRLLAEVSIPIISQAIT